MVLTEQQIIQLVSQIMKLARPNRLFRRLSPYCRQWRCLFGFGTVMIGALFHESISFANQKEQVNRSAPRIDNQPIAKKKQLATTTQVKTVRPEVLRTYPHDPRAFTQGLLLYNGYWFESTGQLGASTLRKVERKSGQIINRIQLNSNLFGEGLARKNNELIQLTWKNGIARRYDISTFKLIKEHRYSGEGWGLCFDGTRFIMSDGSSFLYFRDPETFQQIGRVQVREVAQPVTKLNELECVGNLVYANIWQSHLIARIDPSTGRVLTRIDASNLLSPDKHYQAGVLNGIAYDPQSSHFFLTGKYWSKIFEVRFPFEPGHIDPTEGPTVMDVGTRGCTMIQDRKSILQAWLLGIVALSCRILGRDGILMKHMDR